MLDRIESLENELRDVEIRLGDPAVQSDPRQLADLGRRFKQLEAVVAVGNRLRQSQDDIAEFREMLSAADADERDEFRAEIDRLETTLIETEELTDYEEAFTPFALAGLIALALEIFVRTAVLRRAP